MTHGTAPEVKAALDALVRVTGHLTDTILAQQRLLKDMQRESQQLRVELNVLHRAVVTLAFGAPSEVRAAMIADLRTGSAPSTTPGDPAERATHWKQACARLLASLEGPPEKPTVN
ncbi:hypothetical protein HB662_01355 [Roseomonas frigidaquae]|uniref:Uncharacterized protein n=1 Tax=Falsiroseomonas frigidaquae TaxID=487318 RepID=A0ABX1ERZ4_9PROT|nr:hypothetical protein [Falsiroseomonas frigidaquae]NKE43406.1 hypothetical protein [Falsiroseomonas frigidaquae]